MVMVTSDSVTRVITSMRVLRVLRWSAMRGPPRLPAGRAHQDPLQDLELLEALPGADRHRGQGVLGDVDRHARLVLEPLVEAAQERAAAGEHDPLVHDVGRELGWRAIEGVLHRVNDLAHRLLDRLPNFLA